MAPEFKSVASEAEAPTEESQKIRPGDILTYTGETVRANGQKSGSAVLLREG